MLYGVCDITAVEKNGIKSIVYALHILKVSGHAVALLYLKLILGIAPGYPR